MAKYVAAAILNHVSRYSFLEDQSLITFFSQMILLEASTRMLVLQGCALGLISRRRLIALDETS